MTSYFFLIFLITILTTRVFLFFHPISSPILRNFRIHHYIYGILGMILGLFLQSIPIYAVGLALFVDELTPFILMRGKTHEDNYSKVSLIGTLIFIVLVFFNQEYLLTFFGFS